MTRPIDYPLMVWEDDGGAREREPQPETRPTTGTAESRPGDDPGVDDDAPRILPFLKPPDDEPRRPA